MTNTLIDERFINKLIELTECDAILWKKHWDKNGYSLRIEQTKVCLEFGIVSYILWCYDEKYKELFWGADLLATLWKSVDKNVVRQEKRLSEKRCEDKKVKKQKLMEMRCKDKENEPGSG